MKKCTCLSAFLLAPLHEGRPLHRPQAVHLCYFYSRPSTRGDLCTDRRRLIDAISTRAPTRGANYSFLLAVGYRQFLLAPLHEGRPNGGSGGPPMWGISTRAPTRGATPSHCWIALVSCFFYSRPYAWCEWGGVWPSVVSRLFLLAPLREGRPEMSIMLPPKAPFLLPPLREGRQKNKTPCTQM